MKNIKYLIVIIVLLILNGVLAYKFKLNIKTFNSAASLINRELDENKKEVLILEQNFINEKASENLKLHDSIELIDIDGNVFLTKDLFKKNSVVLRYSEFNCKDCIEAEINALLKNKDKLLNDDIFLIAYYQNRRDLFVYYKEFQKKGLHNIKMYLLPDKGLNIPIDDLNMPFYFCVNSNLIMNNFFIPQKDKPKLSSVYLNYAFKSHF